jgi:hypothetical protein
MREVRRRESEHRASPSTRVARALVFAALLSSLGCGRLGYATSASTYGDSGLDGAADASDGSTQITMDASLLDGGPDASAPEDSGVDLDGSVPTTCGDFPSAVVCSTFDDANGFTAYQTNGQIQLVFGVLDSVTVAPGGSAYYVAAFPAVTSGTLYFRGHIRIVGDFAISNVNPLMIGSYPQSDFGLDFNLLSGARLEVNPSSGAGPAVSTATLARDQWICLQGTIVLGDGTTGSVSVTADGAQLVSSVSVDTLPPGGVKNLSIGIDWTAGDQANSRIQWDDIVLARAPVGCD